MDIGELAKDYGLCINGYDTQQTRQQVHESDLSLIFFSTLAEGKMIVGNK